MKPIFPRIVREVFGVWKKYQKNSNEIKIESRVDKERFSQANKNRELSKNISERKKIKKLCQNKVKFPIMHQLHHIQGLRGKST